METTTKIVLFFSIVILSIVSVPLLNYIIFPGMTTGAGPCYAPTDDNNLINESTVLCTDTYNIVDGDNNGVFQFSTIDIILDGNNSLLVGDGTGKGIETDGKDGLVIKNFNIAEYEILLEANSGSSDCVYNNLNLTNGTAYDIRVSKGSNSTISNSKFNGNFSTNMIYLITSVENMTIINNTFNCTDPKVFKPAVLIRLDSNGTNVVNNTFDNCEGVFTSTDNPTEYTTISDNIFYNSPDVSFSSILIIDANNSQVLRNRLVNGNAEIALIDTENSNVSNNIIDLTTNYFGYRILRSDDILLQNNTINITDMGFSIENSTNIVLDSNNVLNASLSDDIYLTAIQIKQDSNNVSIINNSLTYGSAGILSRQSYNITVADNVFNQISIADKIVTDCIDAREPTFAIGALTKYKGFYIDNPNPSDDIYVSGNTFNDEVQTYLRYQGDIDVTHDLTDYWAIKFNVSGYGNQTGTDYFYNNNNFDYLSNVINADSTEENTVFFKSGIDGSGASINSIFNYSLSKDLQEYYSNDEDNLSFMVDVVYNTPYMVIYTPSETLRTGYAALTLGAYESVNVSLSDCYAPTDDVTHYFNASTTLCTGTYNFPSSGVALFRFSNPNIIFDMNNSKVIGDNSSGSRGFYVNQNNVTIKNGEIGMYERGVWFANADSSIATNLTLHNNSEAGIRVSSTDYMKVDDCYFIDNYYRGINFAIASLYSNISNNRFNTQLTGSSIYVEANSDNITIFNNDIDTDGAQSIYLQNITGGKVWNNTVNNSGWNSIDIVGFENRVYNNSLYNAGHHHIDLCRQDPGNDTAGNVIYNNYMDTATAENALYVCSGFNNVFYNNTIINCRGFAVEGNYSKIDNNWFYNNTITNCDTRCMFNAAKGTIVQDNILTNASSNVTIWLENRYDARDEASSAQFINNVYNDGMAKILLASYFSGNVTFYESSSDYHYVNFGDNKEWNLSYDGLKDFRVQDSIVSAPNTNLEGYSMAASDNIITTYGPCAIIYDGIVFSDDTDICNGFIYNIIDAGAESVITFSAKDIVLNGRGALMYGDLTGDAIKVERDNVTVQNFKIYNYSKCIYSYGGTNNITVKNNEVGECYTGGIRLRNQNGANIYNNTVENGSISRTTYAISLFNSGENNSIHDNTVNDYYYGIRAQDQNRTLIYDNTINNSGLWGAAVQGYFNQIYDNIITNIHWNGIFFSGFYNVITRNYVESYDHHGVDTHEENNILNAQYNNVTWNNITESVGTPVNAGGACIHIQAATNTTVAYNHCYNLANATMSEDLSLGLGRGSTVQSNVSSGNRVIYNRFTNVAGFWDRVFAENTTVQGNIVTNASFDHFIGKLTGLPNNIYNNIKIINNTLDDSSAYYYIGKSDGDWWINASIEDTSRTTLINYSFDNEIEIDFIGTKNYNIYTNNLRSYLPMYSSSNIYISGTDKFVLMHSLDVTKANKYLYIESGAELVVESGGDIND